MGSDYLRHAADSAHNAHYDRPAVLAALGPVSGRRVLDAACTPGLYTRELLDRGALIERVIEPLPAQTMRQHYPADYEKLTREPGFLLLRLLRPVSG
jgi:hypothetical protein